MEMEALRGHLAECADCARVSAALSQRVARISTLMGDLGEEMLSHVPVRARRGSDAPSWRWIGVPAALAAAVTLAFVLASPRTPPVPPRAIVAASRVSPALAAPQSATASGKPVPAVPAHRRRPAPQRTQQGASGEYYLALDDEPIETGVVMRVALGGGDLQADVIFDSQGRPRAIRPIR
jgi:hypothetical protein